MAELTPLWKAARDASDAESEALVRIRTRVEHSIDSASDVAELVQGVGDVDADAVDRVAARVRAHNPRARRWVGAAAAAAALALFTFWPSPDPALSGPIAAQLTPEVRADAQGSGTVGGVHSAPRIAWQRGRLTLEVTPDAGVDLQVQTDEATVTVVGTVFTVDRSPLGTTVSVERGTVDVACVSGDTYRLQAEDRVSCWPVTLGGLLGRARTLEAQGQDRDAVLATLDVALDTEGPPALRGELLAHRLRLLQDRPAQARATVETYLREGHEPRREEMRSLLRVLESP